MTRNPPTDLATLLKSAGPSPRRKYGYALGVLALCALAGLWILLAKRAEAGDKPPAFVTAPLAKGQIELSITATGNLEPTNEVTVGSELSGTTLEVYVETNDKVVKGQPLAKLDTTRLDQEMESARAARRSALASLSQAQATLRQAEADFARLEELRRLSGGRLPSRSELDAAEATADRARASVLVAEASLGESEARVRINESNLEKAIIKSPIDGIVLTRNIEPGQTVAASFTAPELFVIAEKLEQMKLTVSVAEADIGRLAKGQQASFTVDAWPGRTYQATVRKVAFGSAVVNNVVTYETELEVANDDLSLRPGMTATADIRVAESRDVFLVPTAALRFDPAAASAAPASAEKRTFVQSLSPMPPRRALARPTGAAPGSPARGARIWTLRDGQPVAIEVRLGLNDGRNAEVSSEELVDGLPIIIRTS